MIAILAIAAICYVLYQLFIKGMIWGICLFAAGIYGIRLATLSIVPQSNHTILTFIGYDVSYASFTATLITILGLAYFAKD